jgi:hypothetical protein
MKVYRRFGQSRVLAINRIRANLRGQPSKMPDFADFALSSAEIIEDHVQIGLGGKRAAEICIDDAAAGLDGRAVPKIVRGFQNHPGGIGGLLGRRTTGTPTEASACRCAEQDCIHRRFSALSSDR